MVALLRGDRGCLDLDEELLKGKLLHAEQRARRAASRANRSRKRVPGGGQERVDVRGEVVQPHEVGEATDSPGRQVTRGLTGAVDNASTGCHLASRQRSERQ